MTITPPRPDDTGAYRDRRRRGGALWWLWLLCLLLLALIIAGVVYLIVHNSGSSSSTPKPVAPDTTGPAAAPSSPAVASETPSAAGASGGASTGALVGGGGLAPSPATGPEATAGVYGTVLFASDSAAIDASGDKVVAAAVATAKAAGASSLHVTGYTDTVAGAPVNSPLSQQRADAVAAALRSALPGVTVTGTAVGQADPVATNSTPAGRAQNRRVVIEAG